MAISVAGKESRFARLEAIEWWDQAKLTHARVLVIGAGALGNEVVKNLALLGAGNVAIADMDAVELSNLSRSVLFRESDEGKPKADCAARAFREIFPGGRAVALVGNVLADLGLGWFHWADVVIGALDNREARVFVNAACARVARPWIDGGIEVLRGVVRGFAPPLTACYECTMSQVDWELLNRRRSCSLLARRALANHGAPTTPTSASVIAAIQVQEAVKHLHGMGALLGRGFVFDGADHASTTVNYPISPDCPWHEPAAPIRGEPSFTSATPLHTLWDEGSRLLGGLDAIDLSREIVEHLECAPCGHRASILRPADGVPADRLTCPKCGAECAASFLHSLTAGSPLLDKRAGELGLPAYDIVWARHRSDIVGLELSGDQLSFPSDEPIRQET